MPLAHIELARTARSGRSDDTISSVTAQGGEPRREVTRMPVGLYAPCAGAGMSSFPLEAAAEARRMVRPARLLYSAGVIVLGLLSLCLALAAVGAAALLRRLGWLADVSLPVAWGLMSTVGLGLLLLGATLDDLVRRPARLQQELAGRQLASPWQLRRYETHGFQDPYYEWRYAVGGELLRTLKAKCRPLAHMPRGQCLLAAQDDADWSHEIGLDGDVLWVIGFGH